MEAKTQYIQGYYRNKQDTPTTQKEDGGIIVASSILGSSVILMAIVYWKISLSIFLITAAIYGFKRYQKTRSENAARPQLTVNYMNKSKTLYL